MFDNISFIDYVLHIRDLLSFTIYTSYNYDYYTILNIYIYICT